jgi:hypothetical protein
MMTRTLPTVLLGALLVGATPTPAPTAPAVLDITKITCSDLLGANALDRAAIVMFYWGYEAAKANATTFKTGVLQAATEKLITTCRANNKQTILEAMDNIDVKAF